VRRTAAGVERLYPNTTTGALFALRVLASGAATRYHGNSKESHALN